MKALSPMINNFKVELEKRLQKTSLSKPASAPSKKPEHALSCVRAKAQFQAPISLRYVAPTRAHFHVPTAAVTPAGTSVRSSVHASAPLKRRTNAVGRKLNDSEDLVRFRPESGTNML